MFGAEKFHECMVATDLPLPAELESTAMCLARSDIVTYVRQYKAGGGSVAGTKRYARNYLKDPVRCSQKTIDEIMDIAFPPTSNDYLSECRQRIFQNVCFHLGMWRLKPGESSRHSFFQCVSYDACHECNVCLIEQFRRSRFLAWRWQGRHNLPFNTDAPCRSTES